MDGLKTRRSHIKGLITKCENWVKTNLDAVNDVNQIGIRKNNLMVAYQNYLQIQQEIVTLDPKEVDDNDDTENKFCNTFALLEGKISFLTSPKTNTTLDVSNKDFITELVQGISQTFSTNRAQTVKLPDIMEHFF